MENGKKDPKDVSLPKEDKGKEKNDLNVQPLKEDNLSPKEFRKRFVRTFWLYGACIALGIMQNQRSPALLDLQLLTNTDTDVASTYFTSGNCGYLVGTVGAGLLFDKFHRGRLQLGLAVFFSGLTHFLTVLCPTYATMMSVFFFNGLAFGVIDTTCNSELLRIWRLRAGPFFQGLHFSWALGSVIGPLLDIPFLAPQADDDNSTIFTTVAWTSYDITGTSSMPLSVPNFSQFTDENSTMATGRNTTEAGMSPTPETQIFYAFLIGFGISVLATIPFAFTFCPDGVEPNNTNDLEDQKKAEEDKPNGLYEISKVFYVITLFLLMMYFFLYVTMESNFSSFLVAFLVNDQHWHKVPAAILVSIFWAGFGLMRLAGVLIIRRLSAPKMLFIFSSSLIISLAGFTLSATYHSQVGIYVCSIAVGMSMSVMYPTGVLFVETELFPVTGKVVALFIFSSSAGGMAIPPTYGNLMTHVDQKWFCYLLLIESLLLFSVLSLAVAISKTIFSKSKQYSSTIKAVNP